MRDKHQAAAELHESWNQFRKMIGVPDDRMPNDFATNVECGDLIRTFTQYGHLTMADYENAMNAARLEFNTRKQIAIDQDEKPPFPTLELPEIKIHLNNITAIKKAQALADTPRLAPKATIEDLSAEQLLQVLAQWWPNYHVFGKVKGFLPRLWDEKWYTKETWARAKSIILSRDDKAAHLEIIYQAAHNAFCRAFHEAATVCKSPMTIASEPRISSIKQAEEIQAGIDYANMNNKDNPLKFDALETFRDAIGLATVEQICLIEFGTPTEEEKEIAIRNGIGSQMREKFAAQQPQPEQPIQNSAATVSPMVTKLGDIQP